ncbi:MAG TPA: OsmC family protein [Nitrososphaera sp.]|nr:OsmC family protein [Nitrososphaera sp.]
MGRDSVRMTGTLTSAENVVNGVNVEKLVQTMDAIRQDPEISKFNFRIENYWIEGAHNRAVVSDFYGANRTHRRDRTFFTYDKSEHPVLLGDDRGANPVEYLLVGLAGCITTTLVYHAAARGINITQVDARLDGDIDIQGLLGMSDKVRPGYKSINIKLKVKGDAPKEKLEELVILAERLSPVADVVSHGTPVRVGLDES